MSTYVIGDVHGQLAALKRLLANIRFDQARDSLYFVGDYIDPDPLPDAPIHACVPDSIDTVEYLMQLEKTSRRVICLKGNHEKMMLDVVQPHFGYSERKLRKMDWLSSNSGEETYYQYGCRLAPQRNAIKTWLGNLLMYQTVTVAGRNYYIAHAGVYDRSHNAGKGIWSAEDEALWQQMQPGQNPFLGFKQYDGYTLVCGHVVTTEYCGAYRIYADDHFVDVDTGARLIGIDAGAHLSALRLDDMAAFSD